MVTETLTTDPLGTLPYTPLPEAGLSELDALLASIETVPEGDRRLFIPVSPSVVRWLLRGTFEVDGKRARMIGGTVRGDEFLPLFAEVSS